MGLPRGKQQPQLPHLQAQPRMRRWWRRDRWRKVSAAVVDGWQEGLATGEAAMKQNEWAELHPEFVIWFEANEECPVPLCRYPQKRHHHLKGTIRQYDRIAQSQFPFMHLYYQAQANAVRSAQRRMRKIERQP